MINSDNPMEVALALAAKGRGYVEPNPMVGAVVLDASGQVVGEGWHEKFGEAHAEVNAFKQAGDRARGGTLFVTLEPCSHFGKTPPCVEAVIASGVKRVVAAMEDPFPEVAGRGIAKLRRAGIETHVGICEYEAKRLNAPYLKLLRTGKPWVHLKWAMSLDGKIATRTGDSKWISCVESRRRVHELRGRMDAIIVGRGTVEKDDPLLTARPPGPRVATRVVLSASGVLPEKCLLRTTLHQAPVLVFTGLGNESKLAGWVADGCEVVAMPVTNVGPSIEEILKELGRREMTNVLVEGGAGVLGSILNERSNPWIRGAADEVHVFLCPKIIGGADAPSAIGAKGVESIQKALDIAGLTFTPSGSDMYLHGYPERYR